MSVHRTPALTVLQPITLPASWEILPGVPATRGDCFDGPRPCPYVECRHHLWASLHRDQRGNPQKGRQGASTLRPLTMESCALDVADRLGLSYTEVGKLLGINPTRVRQIEAVALAKLEVLGVDLKELLGQ